jgi:hypothetical protein
VAKVYRLFRTIMSTAVDDGLLRSNPVSIKGAAAEERHARPVRSAAPPSATDAASAVAVT